MCSSSVMRACRGSPAGMHRILSSPPASSRMWNMPIGLARTMQPGKVGSCRSTSASRGSPSSPRVSSTAVVGRVAHRGEEQAVEADAAGLVVDLVLVAVPLGISMVTSNSTTAALLDWWCGNDLGSRTSVPYPHGRAPRGSRAPDSRCSPRHAPRRGRLPRARRPRPGARPSPATRRPPRLRRPRADLPTGHTARHRPHPGGDPSPAPRRRRLRASPRTHGPQAALADRLADPALGPSIGVSVRGAFTGAHLLDIDADRPRVPASTAKMLTALAVGVTLDPASTLPTTVVQGRAPGEIVLVAGGDSSSVPARDGRPRSRARRAR